MAYTYNDVQSSKAVSALEGGSSETAEEGLDMESWDALQKAYMSSAAFPSMDFGTDSVKSASEQSIAHITGVGNAMLRMTEAQSVANIHVTSNNFIRDSITGK